MKKPKFNIGDKVKTTIYGSIAGTEASVEVQWYICGINYYMSAHFENLEAAFLSCIKEFQENS